MAIDVYAKPTTAPKLTHSIADRLRGKHMGRMTNSVTARRMV